MTLVESQIKKAILHPEEVVREFAVLHFAHIHSADTEIVPLVIQATEKYGRENAFGILRAADNLPLTVEVVDWLINELGEIPSSSSIGLDNARFAMALLLCDPQSDLIPARSSEILKLPGFPSFLKNTILDILRMADWDWPTAWQNLLEFGKQLCVQDDISTYQHRALHRMIQFMARFRQQGSEQVLDVLRNIHTGPQQLLLDYLRPWIIQLAGQMRLEPAIPLLIKCLKSSDDDAADECGTALGYIATDAVVDAVWQAWPRTTVQQQVGLTTALRPIISTRCVEVCEKLLQLEPDVEIIELICDRLLHQFNHRAIDIIRSLVNRANQDSYPHIFNLRSDLVLAATIIESKFQEYDEWFQEEKQNNFGRFNTANSVRVSKHFESDKSLKAKMLEILAEDDLARIDSERATREQILNAILHPNPTTRRMAVEYFANAYLPEPEVMPHIIQAVERYGRKNCYDLFQSSGYYYHSQ